MISLPQIPDPSDVFMATPIALLKPSMSGVVNIEAIVLALGDKVLVSRGSKEQAIWPLWMADESGSIVVNLFTFNLPPLQIGDILRVRSADTSLTKHHLHVKVVNDSLVKRVGFLTKGYLEAPNHSWNTWELRNDVWNRSGSGRGQVGWNPVIDTSEKRKWAPGGGKEDAEQEDEEGDANSIDQDKRPRHEGGNDMKRLASGGRGRGRGWGRGRGRGERGGGPPRGNVW